MNIAIEIDTPPGDHLEFDLFGVRQIESGKTRTDVPGGAQLHFDSVYFRKAADFPNTIHALLVLGREVGVGLVSAWLYDKLNGRATTLRISRREVQIEKGEITRVLTEEIERRE